MIDMLSSSWQLMLAWEMRRLVARGWRYGNSDVRGHTGEARTQNAVTL